MEERAAHCVTPVHRVDSELSVVEEETSSGKEGDGHEEQKKIDFAAKEAESLPPLPPEVSNPSSPKFEQQQLQQQQQQPPPKPAFVKVTSELLDSLPESHVDPVTPHCVITTTTHTTSQHQVPIVVVTTTSTAEDGGDGLVGNHEGGETIKPMERKLMKLRRCRSPSPLKSCPLVVRQDRRTSLPVVTSSVSVALVPGRSQQSAVRTPEKHLLHPGNNLQSTLRSKSSSPRPAIRRSSSPSANYWNGLHAAKHQQARKASLDQPQVVISSPTEDIYAVPNKFSVPRNPTRQPKEKLDPDPNKIVVKVPPKPVPSRSISVEDLQRSPRRSGPSGPHHHLHHHHHAHHHKLNKESQIPFYQSGQGKPAGRKKKMAPPPPPRTNASREAVGSWISGLKTNVNASSKQEASYISQEMPDENDQFRSDFNGPNSAVASDTDDGEYSETATQILSEEEQDDDKVNLVEEQTIEHHSPKSGQPSQQATPEMRKSRSALSASRVSVATQVSNSDEEMDAEEREQKSATLPRNFSRYIKKAVSPEESEGKMSPYARKSVGSAIGTPNIALSRISHCRSVSVERTLSSEKDREEESSPQKESMNLRPLTPMLACFTRKYMTPQKSSQQGHLLMTTSTPLSTAVTPATSSLSTSKQRSMTTTSLQKQSRWATSSTNLLGISSGISGALEKREAENTHFIIVAVDFGTTYSGYAFCFTQKPNEIQVMHKWPGDPDLSNQKTRTALLLKPNGEFDSFGFVARDRYHDLRPSEAASYLFFEKFKMVLHHDKSLSRDTQITAVNGKSMPAVVVFRHALKFFCDHALSEIGESCGLNGGLSEEDIRWVLTVPAIWRQPAKQLMREAAYKAGMASPDHPQRLLIALEPEAAAIYCRKLKFWDLKDRALATSIHTRRSNSPLSEYVIKEVQKGTTYMVVDCGGGTVDITVHEIMDTEGNMKEIQKASGDACGSIEVDQAFEKLLEKIFSEDRFHEWKRKHPSAYVHLLAAFEAKKRYARPAKQDPANVSLPLSFITFFERQKKGAVEEAIQRCGIPGVSWTEQGMIRLGPKMMEELFDPTLEKLVKLVQAVFTSIPMGRKINYLFLVGGFAESPLLQDRIKREFQDRTKVIIPNGPAVVVLKGASMFGVDPSVVKVRRARMTYGVGILHPFNPAIHPTSKKVRQGDIDWCADCFDKFVMEDDSVQLGDVVLRRYTPARPDQTTMVLQLYSSTKADAEFITDNGVKLCGVLRLDLIQSRLDVAYSKNPTREIQVRMVLGDTEIRASALDLATGCHVKTNIDFLAY